MDTTQVMVLFTGAMGAMATSVITLYRALTAVYTAQVKDAQAERDSWKKLAQDAMEVVRSQGSVAVRAVAAAERRTE